MEETKHNKLNATKPNPIQFFSYFISWRLKRNTIHQLTGMIVINLNKME